MKIQRYKTKDYKAVSKLYMAWDWGVAPPSSILNDGYIVTDRDKVVSACFLYRDNKSKVAFLAYPVASKDLSPSKRVLVIDKMINKINKVLERLGFNVIFSITSNESLIRLLNRNDYKAVENSTQFLVNNLSKSNLEFLNE